MLAPTVQLLPQVFYLIHDGVPVLGFVVVVQFAQASFDLVEFVEDELSPAVLRGQSLALVVLVVVNVVLTAICVGNVPPSRL